MKKLLFIAILLCSRIAHAGLWAVVNTSLSTPVAGPMPWNQQAIYQSMLPLGVAVMPPAAEPAGALAVTPTYSIMPVAVNQTALAAGQIAGSPTWTIGATSATESIPAVYMPLAQAQTNQLAILDTAYQSASHANLSYMGTSFLADETSQQNLAKTLLGLQSSATTPAGFYWLDANGAQVSMTYAQLQGLAQAMLSQGWAAFQHLQIQKAAVRTATTSAAVAAIGW